MADLTTLSTSIVNDLLHTIIHTLVLEIHSAETALQRTCDPKTHTPLCPSCSLPRLLDPPLSNSSRPDKTTQFCAHIPWSRKPGHDIYGNPFPVAGADKPPTKKEREAKAKADAAKRKDSNAGDAGGAGDDDDGLAAGLNIAGGPVDKKAAKVGERLKGGTYVPWHTCPGCKRSLLITRFAQHLEKCLGIGGRGRAAAQAARQKGTDSVGTAAGRDGSRGGTPVGRRDADGDAEDGGAGSADDDGPVAMRKKVLKKGLKKGGAGGANGLAASGSKKKEDGSQGKEKRKADEDDDDAVAPPVKKKQKLQRQLSSASFVTAGSTLDDDTLLDTGGGDGRTNDNESVDGSFVNNDDDDASEED